MLRSARTAGVTVTTFMPPNTATFSASVVGKSVTSSRALRLSPPPVAEAHAQRIAGARVEHDRLPIEERPQPSAACVHEYVARRDTGPARGPARRDLGHTQAARPLPSLPILRARDVETHPGTPHLPEAPPLVRHPQRPLDRDRKPESHRSS